MQAYKLQTSLLLFCFVAVAGCAKRVYSVSEVTRPTTHNESTGAGVSSTAAQAVDANAYVEIQFEPGASNLSETQKDSIRAMIDRSKARGEIDEIMVLSWADKEYPGKEEKRLTNKQVELAAKRGRAIKDFIGRVESDIDVDRYNMAKRPGMLAKWFNTTDAQLKRTLVEAGLPTTSDAVQQPSKASHAVVILRMERD